MLGNVFIPLSKSPDVVSLAELVGPQVWLRMPAGDTVPADKSELCCAGAANAIRLSQETTVFTLSTSLTPWAPSGVKPAPSDVKPTIFHSPETEALNFGAEFAPYPGASTPAAPEHAVFTPDCAGVSGVHKLDSSSRCGCTVDDACRARSANDVRPTTFQPLPRSRPTDTSGSLDPQLFSLSEASVGKVLPPPAAKLASFPEVMENTLLACAVRNGRIDAGLPGEAGPSLFAACDCGLIVGLSTVKAWFEPPDRAVVSMRGDGITLVEVVAMATG